MAWRCVVGRVIVEMLYGKPCCLTARMQLGDQFFRIGLYGIAHIDILYQMIIFQMHHATDMRCFSGDIIGKINIKPFAIGIRESVCQKTYGRCSRAGCEMVIRKKGGQFLNGTFCAFRESGMPGDARGIYAKVGPFLPAYDASAIFCQHLDSVGRKAAQNGMGGIRHRVGRNTAGKFNQV